MSPAASVDRGRPRARREGWTVRPRHPRYRTYVRPRTVTVSRDAAGRTRRPAAVASTWSVVCVTCRAGSAPGPGVAAALDGVEHDVGRLPGTRATCCGRPRSRCGGSAARPRSRRARPSRPCSARCPRTGSGERRPRSSRPGTARAGPPCRGRRGSTSARCSRAGTPPSPPRTTRSRPGGAGVERPNAAPSDIPAAWTLRRSTQ